MESAERKGWGWKPKERSWNAKSWKAWEYRFSQRIIILALVALLVGIGLVLVGVGQGGGILLLLGAVLFVVGLYVLMECAETHIARLEIKRIGDGPSDGLMRRAQEEMGLHRVDVLPICAVLVFVIASLTTAHADTIAASLLIAFFVGFLLFCLRFSSIYDSRWQVIMIETYLRSRGPKSGTFEIEPWEEPEFPRFRTKQPLRVEFEWDGGHCCVVNEELAVYTSGPTLASVADWLKEAVASTVEDLFFLIGPSNRDMVELQEVWLEHVELIDVPDPQKFEGTRKSLSDVR